MKSKEIIVKSMLVSDATFVDNTTGEVIPRVRLEFDCQIPKGKKAEDGSLTDVEDTVLIMNASQFRARLYAASPLIRDARRSKGISLDLESINGLLDLAASQGSIKVIATRVEANEEFDGFLFAHAGYSYSFAIQFTDDDVAVAAKAAEKRRNAAKALLGI